MKRVILELGDEMKKFLILIITMLLCCGVCVSAYWLRTEIITSSSLNDEYSIEARWTDVGGWGYRGKIYLVQNNAIFAKKYFTGKVVPAKYDWISDTEFYIDNGSGKKVFDINDFLKKE